MRIELARLDKTLAETVRAYMIGKCTAVVAFSEKSGWYLSVSHPDRTPTWKEIRAARGQLIPKPARMALILDPELNIKESTKVFHMWEVDSIYKKPHIDPGGRFLGDEK
jgi:hypothetical protein